jgi:PD-(D/E)XK nuclease superfamily
MYLLDFIRGKDGEKLASACLAYLLMRSLEMRHAFLEIAAEAGGLAPPSVGTRFGVELEPATTQENGDTAGYLDLLIETGNSVIGVENKIFAGFQPGQPERYWDTVTGSAQNLAKCYGRPVKDCLLVLAPQNREREILGHLQQSKARTGKPVAFVPWETVLDEFARTHTLDAAAAVARDELNDFLRRQLEFLHRFPAKLPRLRLPIGDSANETQAAFLQRLWTAFRPETLYEYRSFRPKPKRNIYYGGYFLQGTWDLGWYGFQNAVTLGDTTRPPDRVLFVLGLNVPIRDALRGASLHGMQEVPSGSGRQGWGSLWGVWATEPKLEMGRPEFWTEMLEPIHAAVSELPEADRIKAGFLLRSADN